MSEIESGWLLEVAPHYYKVIIIFFLLKIAFVSQSLYLRKSEIG